MCIYLNGEVLLTVHVLHAVCAVDAVQFFDRLFLVRTYLLNEADRRVVYVLFRGSDRLLTTTQRVHLCVERRDLRLTTPATARVNSLCSIDVKTFLTFFKKITARFYAF